MTVSVHDPDCPVLRLDGQDKATATSAAGEVLTAATVTTALPETVSPEASVTA